MLAFFYGITFGCLEEINATVTSSATIVNLSSIQRYHQCLNLSRQLSDQGHKR